MRAAPAPRLPAGPAGASRRTLADRQPGTRPQGARNGHSLQRQKRREIARVAGHRRRHVLRPAPYRDRTDGFLLSGQGRIRRPAAAARMRAAVASAVDAATREHQIDAGDRRLRDPQHARHPAQGDAHDNLRGMARIFRWRRAAAAASEPPQHRLVPAASVVRNRDAPGIETARTQTDARLTAQESSGGEVARPRTPAQSPASMLRTFFHRGATSNENNRNLTTRRGTSCAIQRRGVYARRYSNTRLRIM